MRLFMTLRRYLMVTFAVILLAQGSFAQQQTASLTGQITDSTGAAVPGAQVTVRDPERGTKVTVTTDERGNYLVPEIDPGDHYQIAVAKTGFKETVQRDVVLQ